MGDEVENRRDTFAGGCVTTNGSMLRSDAVLGIRREATLIKSVPVSVLFAAAEDGAPSAKATLNDVSAQHSP